MSRKHLPQRVFMALCLLVMLSYAVAFVDSPLVHATSLQPKVSQRGAGLRPFIDTWKNIHLFQGFDYNIADPTPIAERYDFVWGASLYNVAAWRKGNPNIFLTYYIPFNRDFGTFTDHSALHDLAWWQANYPDWILYRCDKKTPAYFGSSDNVPLDFSNSAVISWQVQTYAQPASASGYDGIAADNADLGNWTGACGVYRNGTWMQLYSGQRQDDPAWQNNVIFWLSQMQNALHGLNPPLALIPNTSFADVPVTSPLVQKMADHVDAFGEEGGFTLQGKGYLTGTAWLQHMTFIASLQAQGKAYYSANQFPSVGKQEIQWALASYLMCKAHAAALAISGIQQYGSANWYPEYAAQLGNPSGAMSQDQQVYWRFYTNGLTIANPSATQSYMITLPSGVHYVDLYGNHVGPTITMAIHTGMVLLVAP
jgi:hypothetical protein